MGFLGFGRKSAEIVPDKHDLARARLGTPEERLGEDWTLAYGQEAVRAAITRRKPGDTAAFVYDDPGESLLWYVDPPDDMLPLHETPEQAALTQSAYDESLRMIRELAAEMGAHVAVDPVGPV